MTTAAHPCRPMRLFAAVSGAVSLVLALAAASPSSAGDAVAGTHAAAGARATAPGGTWGTAMQVPGTAALNTGGDAAITSVSCARAGNCSAGGFYTGAPHHAQAFVAGEVNGVWGPAQEVPGTAALNKSGSAAITSVSCASAGNCSAGGDYLDAFVRFQVFVVNET